MPTRSVHLPDDLDDYVREAPSPSSYMGAVLARHRDEVSEATARLADLAPDLRTAGVLALLHWTPAPGRPLEEEIRTQINRRASMIATRVPEGPALGTLLSLPGDSLRALVTLARELAMGRVAGVL